LLQVVLQKIIDKVNKVQHKKGMKDWNPKAIKKLRKGHNLTLKSFAELIGVSQRYVIYLENGMRKPSKILKNLLNRIEQELK